MGERDHRTFEAVQVRYTLYLISCCTTCTPATKGNQAWGPDAYRESRFLSGSPGNPHPGTGDADDDRISHPGPDVHLQLQSVQIAFPFFQLLLLSYFFWFFKINTSFTFKRIFKFPGIREHLASLYVVIPRAQMGLIHDWSGIFMAFFVLIHLILNWGWIKSMTRLVIIKNIK